MKLRKNLPHLHLFSAVLTVSRVEDCFGRTTSPLFVTQFDVSDRSLNIIARFVDHFLLGFNSHCFAVALKLCQTLGSSSFSLLARSFRVFVIEAGSDVFTRALFFSAYQTS
jgi:hypothetical protein